MEKEVIFSDDLEKIFGKRPWKSHYDEEPAEAKPKAEPKPKLTPKATSKKKEVPEDQDAAGS